MKRSLQQVITKILVFPAIFSFALACCQPMFVQAAEVNDGHTEVQIEQRVSRASELTIDEGHDCDHNDHHEQSALRAPTQKISVDSAFSNLVSSPISFYQYPRVDSHFVTLPRITGPPWDGKSIKGYLGIYRS